jgi:hypothetical protein
VKTLAYEYIQKLTNNKIKHSIYLYIQSNAHSRTQARFKRDHREPHYINTQIKNINYLQLINYRTFY